MGREIRRVPVGWEHPKDNKGIYIPMFDKDYESAAEEWLKNCASWEEGTHPDRWTEYGKDYNYFWDYEDGPPDKESYRPKFLSKPDHYQIYETVTEGTPTSPVFKTLNEMVQWLMVEGYSNEAAQNFAKGGYAPSMVIMGDVMKMGIHACEDLNK